MIDVQLKVTGVEEFGAILREIPVKLKRRALRNALAAGARLVRDAARMNRRTSSAGSPLTGNDFRNYKRGSVMRAINVRTSKIATRAGDVGVFVNVRPLKRGAAGDKTKLGRAGRANPNDVYYWRWIEWGTKFMTARPFLTPAAGKLTDALRKFEQVLGPQLEKLNHNAKDPL